MLLTAALQSGDSHIKDVFRNIHRAHTLNTLALFFDPLDLNFPLNPTALKNNVLIFPKYQLIRD
jgi:hypothetical protein